MRLGLKILTKEGHPGKLMAYPVGGDAATPAPPTPPNPETLYGPLTNSIDRVRMIVNGVPQTVLPRPPQGYTYGGWTDLTGSFVPR